MAHLPMPTALPLCQALRAHALWESSSAAPVRAASLWLLIVLLEAPVHSAPFCDSVGPHAAVELFAYAAQQPPPPLRAAALFGLQRTMTRRNPAECARGDSCRRGRTPPGSCASSSAAGPSLRAWPRCTCC